MFSGCSSAIMPPKEVADATTATTTKLTYADMITVRRCLPSFQMSGNLMPVECWLASDNCRWFCQRRFIPSGHQKVRLYRCCMRKWSVVLTPGLLLFRYLLEHYKLTAGNTFDNLIAAALKRGKEKGFFLMPSPSGKVRLVALQPKRKPAKKVSTVSRFIIVMQEKRKYSQDLCNRCPLVTPSPKYAFSLPFQGMILY